jgi:hypothetical protein
LCSSSPSTPFPNYDVINFRIQKRGKESLPRATLSPPLPMGDSPQRSISVSGRGSTLTRRKERTRPALPKTPGSSRKLGVAAAASPPPQHHQPQQPSPQAVVDDTEKTELRKRVRELERIRLSLEKEKVEVLQHNKAQQADHHKQLEHWRGQVARVEEERDAMQARHSKALRIDSAILDLYLQFRDRTGDTRLNFDPLSDNDLRTELEMRQPLQVLEMLQAELRSLAAFKDEFEEELHSQHDQKRSLLEQDNVRLIERAEAAEARCAEQAAALAGVEHDLEEKRGEHEGLIQAREATSQSLMEKHQAHRDELGRLRAENKELGHENQRLQVKLREKEALAATATQLQHQLALQQHKHQATVESMTATHKKQLATVEAQATSLFDASSEVKELRAQNRRLQEAVRTAEKSSPSARAAAEAASEISKLKTKLESTKASGASAFAEARELKMKLASATKARDAARREVVTLRVEAEVRNKELRYAHAQQAVLESGSGRTSFVEDEVNRNHSHIQVYKNLLRQKDKEVADLNARVTTLLDHSNRSVLQRKGAELEAQQLQRGVDQLRSKLEETKRAKRPVTAPTTLRRRLRGSARVPSSGELAGLWEDKSAEPANEPPPKLAPLGDWFEEQSTKLESSGTESEEEAEDMDPLEALEARERETLRLPPGAIRSIKTG